jgi:hypothetical protein
MEERRSLPPYEDELSLALLRSAEHDEPPPAAYSKVAAALGVSAAASVAASLPAQAALASNGLSAGAARFSGSLLAKVVVVGVSGVLFVAGGAALLRLRQRAHQRADLALRATAPVRPSAPNITLEPASAQLPAPAAPSEAATTQDAPGESADSANAPPATGALASAETAPTPPLSNSNNAGSALVSTVKSAPAQHTTNANAARRELHEKVSTLPEQVSSLDRARVALDSGNSAGALLEIAHYRRAWPHGVFLTEASVLEIEALAKRGEIALASTRAQAFVKAHPDSPQAERLRALIPRDER